MLPPAGVTRRGAAAAVPLLLLLALCCSLAPAARAVRSGTWACAEPGPVCNALGDLYADTGGATTWSAFGSKTQLTTASVGWRGADAGPTPAISYCTFFGITCTGGVITELCAPRVRAASGHGVACTRAHVSVTRVLRFC